MNYTLVGLMTNLSFTCVKDNNGSIKGFPGAKVCKHLLLCHLQINTESVLMHLSCHTEADPDLEQKGWEGGGGGGELSGWIWFACPGGFSPFCDFFFFTQNIGGEGGDSHCDTRKHTRRKASGSHTTLLQLLKQP